MPERLIFVSPTGSDANGDGSEANPFRTQDRALVPPGAGGPEWDDHATLLLKKGGTYPHFNLNRGGLNLLQPFRVTSYGEGPPPVVASMSVQRGEDIHHVCIEGLDFRRGSASQLIGLCWRASGSNASIRECSATGFEMGATFQSTDDVTKDVFEGMKVWNFKARNCTAQGAYIQGQKNIHFYSPNIQDIGTNMYHQGLYFNSDNTSYTVKNGFFRNIANCAIQARSGLMDISNNTIVSSGYGIAVGHGMSSSVGRGSITRNVITKGKDRPDGAPLTCGIGVCMVDHNTGNPFLIQENIIHGAEGSGLLGGISLGNDLAVPYTNSNGVLTREMGQVLCEGNWVQGWPVGIRLVENYPLRMGITSNTFLAFRYGALLVNSLKWKAQNVRQFGDPLSVSQIMQQNNWYEENAPIALEEGGFSDFLEFPKEWRSAFDPGYSYLAPSEVSSLQDLNPESPNYNDECRHRVFG